ncbi:MAG TPA: hypothetical protein VER58_16065 [Thermoanaerobaculia bacterium]|nr:hypothetical protein [Thermoanaerobaculia bacterium]
MLRVSAFHSLALVALLVITGCAKKEPTAVSDTSASSPPGTATSATQSAPAAAQSTGACSYITEAEATVILGQPSKYRSTEGTSSNCIIDPVSGQGISVDFTIERNSRGIFDFLSTQKGAEKLSGLGDQAVWTGGKGMGQLAVVKGGNSMNLTISDFSGKTELKPMGQAVAQKLLAKL